VHANMAVALSAKALRARTLSACLRLERDRRSNLPRAAAEPEALAH